MPDLAAAQVSAEASIQSDYRLRGYSVSDGHAVASVALGYDDPSGFYAGGTVAGRIADGEPELLLVEGHAGYAWRVAPQLSLDVGATHNQYYSGYGTSRNYQYSEVYVGLAGPHLSGRISYSPNYYFEDTPTIYAEVGAGVEPAPNWFLSAHAGVLAYLDEAPYYLPSHRYDWRFGISRQVGPWGFNADVSGRVQGEASRYAGDGAAATVGVTFAF